MGEKLVDVYRASGEAEAYIIKGKLEANGIPCLLRSNAARSVHMFTVDGMGEIKIAVNESMAEEARRLIEEDPRSLNDGEGAPEE
jgi:alkaline phosphatase